MISQTCRVISFPTELIHFILAISLGNYLADFILLPTIPLTWDPIITLLHVSSTFRACTIKLLYCLWGETFIRDRATYVTLLHGMCIG